MSKEQLNLFEAWIIAVVRDENSIHVEDTLWKNQVREELEIALGIREPK